MATWRLIAWLIALAWSSVLSAGERIALLPLVDSGEESASRGPLTSELRSQLIRDGFDLISEDSVAATLRQLRLRNTAAPLDAEIETMAGLMGADFLLVGTIHRFRTDTLLSEACVCVRLIRTSDLVVAWNNCVTRSGGGEISLLTARATRSGTRLARAVARKLVSDFTLEPKKRRTEVTGLVVGRREKITQPCSTVAVIPPTDEQGYSLGSEMIGDLLGVALRRRGVNVADRGRVRAVMLEGEDLRYGQSVKDISRLLRDSLGVDLILTGSISELTLARDAGLGAQPVVALQLRWIDPSSDAVIWAETLERKGDDRKGLFDVGIVHSPALLAKQVVDDFVSDLRLVRRRVEPIRGN